jgi:hypothetical protein
MWHRMVKASKEAMDDINEGREREGLPKLRLVKDVREELEVAKTERESKGLALVTKNDVEDIRRRGTFRIRLPFNAPRALACRYLL